MISFTLSYINQEDRLKQNNNTIADISMSNHKAQEEESNYLLWEFSCCDLKFNSSLLHALSSAAEEHESEVMLSSKSCGVDLFA